MAEIRGTADNDTLRGTTTFDRIYGLEGDDTLIGGPGSDTLYGGPGDDRLEGGSGFNTLRGGLGADRLVGGPSFDLYVVDDLLDDIVDEDGGGIWATVSWTLAEPFNSLRLLNEGGAINGTGNDLRNGIRGNSSDNVLSGKGGDDHLRGREGDDVLIGGMGADRLNGGAGADVFDFNAVEESGLGLTRDIIKGFVNGLDKIDLEDMDANENVSGNQAFTWVKANDLDASFTGKAGQLRFTEQGALLGDTDGDRKADFKIAVFRGGELDLVGVGDVIL